MPRLNNRGQVVAGVGDGIVSIDKVPVGRGGGACWLDDDRIIYGGPQDGRWQTLTNGSAVLDTQGPNSLAASGGRYLGQNATGVYGTLSVPSSARVSLADTDGRGAADRNGTIAITDQTGQGFRLIAPNGEVTEGAPGYAAYGLTVVGPQHAIWPRGDGFETLNLPVPTALAKPGRCCWCNAAGQVILVYYAHNVGLVWHPFGSFLGGVIESLPVFFHYDAIGMGDRVRVTYSRTVGELPGDIVILDLDLSAAVDLRRFLPDTGTTPPDVGTPPPPKEEPPVSEMYLPEPVYRIVVQLSERNRALAEGTDDDRRALTKLIAEQVRYSIGPQWGWKSNHANGHAPSKDAIAFIGDEAVLENQRQGMFVFDLFNGSTRQPHPLPLKGEWVEQYFIPVRPVNHLGFAPPEAPPKPPPPPPDKPVDPDAIRDLREQIGLLRAAVADVSGVAESAIARAANAEAQTAQCKVAVAELEARMDAVEHRFKRLVAEGKTRVSLGPFSREVYLSLPVVERE